MEISLRPRVASDDALHYAWQADPAQVATTVPARSREAFDAWIARIAADPTVVLRTILADGDVAGTIDTFLVGGDRFIGYRVANEHWGKGVATAAIRAMVSLDRSRPLFATVLATNVASLRALSRNGFVPALRRMSGDGPEVVLRLDAE